MKYRTILASLCHHKTKFYTFWCIFIISTTVVYSACPNSCSGHGTCSTETTCDCFDGWDYAADCSVRVCPFGAAWADKAFATNQAHSPSECSGAGRCNRETGICECHDGFSGVACQRAMCPNGCSGNGVCMTLADAGVFYGLDYDNSVDNGGDGVGPIYTNWDGEAIGICFCDWGSYGPDCSLKYCPKGDDPVSVNQSNRQIVFRLATDAVEISGLLHINFLGHKVTIDLNSTYVDVDSYCKSKFEEAENIEKVLCAASSGFDSDNSWLSNGAFIEYNVTFVSWPSFPMENNFFSHNGNPDLSEFTCDISEVTLSGGSNRECKLIDVVNSGVTEYEICSRRGLCDVVTGFCTCFKPYAGHDCTMLSYYSETANSDPAIAVTATGPYYTGDILKVDSQRETTTDYNFMTFRANGNQVFRVDGRGEMRIPGITTTSTGITIEDAGLNVISGGIDISEGGLLVNSSTFDGNTFEVRSTSVGFEAATIGAYCDNTVFTTAYNFLEAGYSHDELLFSVRGDGKVSISEGGLDVNDGLVVGSGGAIIHGGVNLPDGSVAIETTTNASETVLTAYAKNDLHEGTVLLVQTDAQPGTSTEELIHVKLNVDGDGGDSDSSIFKITAQPLTEIVTGGLKVSSGGVTIDSGGLVISTAGLTINAGGINVVSGGITSSDLLTAESGIVVSSGATTVSSLSASDLIEGSSGLVISGAMSTFSGITATAEIVGKNGLTVEGSVATITSGMTVSGTTTVAGLASSGLITSTAGLIVSGSTTTTAALTASGLITGNNGLVITGAITTISSGISISGTTTIDSLTASGLITGASGMTITGAITSSGDVTANSFITTSDSRFKQNIKPIDEEYALELLIQLNGVEYSWNKNEYPSRNFDTNSQFGFIAQEVEQIVPNIVVTDEMGFKSIKYTQIIALLVEAIKKHNSKISLLELEILELKRLLIDANS